MFKDVPECLCEREHFIHIYHNCKYCEMCPYDRRKERNINCALNNGI